MQRKILVIKRGQTVPQRANAAPVRDFTPQTLTQVPIREMRGHRQELALDSIRQKLLADRKPVPTVTEVFG